MTIEIPDYMDGGLLLRHFHGALVPGSAEEWRAEEMLEELIKCVPNEDYCNQSVN